MNVAKRTSKLKALLDVRTGPGAAVLSIDVKKIHLEFARTINDGHFGARKLWRTHLRRLKYHNPAISMSVNRHINNAGPATLAIHFAHPSPSSPATAPSTTDPSVPFGHRPSNRIETIDMKHKHENDILSRLLELTNGVPYEITPEERAELEEVKVYQNNSERDRARQARLNQTKREEKRLLDLARGNTAEAT